MAAGGGGGGETKDSVSGWTVDTLHAHYNTILAMGERFHAERDRRYEAIERAQKLAVDTANEVITARLIAMNEWRATVTDIMATLMPRKEAEAMITSSTQRSDASTKMLMDKIEQLGMSLTAKIDAQGTTSDKREGKSAGLAAMGGWIVSIILLIIAVVGFYKGG